MWNLLGLGIGPVSPTWAGRFPSTGPPGKPCCKLFPPLIYLCLIKGNYNTVMVSAMHQHGSAIAILTSPPLWKTFNAGILCFRSCPCTSGHNIPLSPQQDKSFCLLCNFLSLYEWESVIPFKFRTLKIVLVPQSCPILCDPKDCRPPGSLSMEFSRQEY